MNASYTRSQRLLEYTAIFLFVALAGWSLWHLAAAGGWTLAPILLLSAPLAWLATDLLSGLLHWALDSFGSVNTPVIGNGFIRPFREHHADPAAMTRHDFVETHGASCFAALPLLAATSMMPLGSPALLATGAFMLLLAFGALATNQCHKWAHMDEKHTPGLVRWLQRRRFILTRDQHRLHHAPPFDSHFCTASGWLNAPLDAVLRLWR